MKRTFEKTDIYQLVTDRIITALEQGCVPWQRPWSLTSSAQTMALSHESGNAYSFLNQMLLGEPGEYITFRRAKELGGSIRKGAKGRPVVFWKPVVHKETEEDGTERIRTIPVLKRYTVFHLTDTEGIESRFAGKEERTASLSSPLSPVEQADVTAQEYVGRNEPLRLCIIYSGKAYYSHSDDKVVVPKMSQFRSAEEYYSVLYHELVHSTGHESRCNRRDAGAVAAYGDNAYAKEELTAEMGAAMALSCLGIDSEQAFDNSAAYIDGWLRKLRNDKTLVVRAACKAEQAVKFIFGVKNEEESSEDDE
jgi:antirestriction protein ArdC